MMLHAIIARYARLLLAGWVFAVAAAAGAAYPGEVSVKANEAKEAYEKGNFEEAARLYDEAIKLDPNDPRLKMNLGLTNFKEGKPDKALEQLSSVYDENDVGLVARSRTGSGLVVQHQARETLETSQKDQEAKSGTDGKDAKEQTIALLKSSLEKYREGLVMGQAALNEQTLNDTRYNYEIARRQLEELLKKQEEEKQQQQDQQQNQQDQKDQQQKDQQQNQQDQKDQKQQQDQKDQKSKEDQQKQEQEQKDQQQKQDQQNQQQQDQQKQDEQKGEQGEPKKDEKPEGQPTPTPSPNGQPSPTPTPAPTPQATPPPNATPPPDKGDEATGGNPNSQSPEQPQEMSKEDVDRLINGLPDNDREALQRFYGNQKQSNERMEKDW